MKVLEAQIEINAPVELVWQHLTDFSAYPQWNPFITRASGELKQGAIVHFKAAPAPMEVTAPITSLIPNKEFIWEAKAPFPGFYPRYIRRLEALSDERTLFINREEFKGWAAPVIVGVTNLFYGSIYKQTCEALKQRVEAAYTQR